MNTRSFCNIVTLFGAAMLVGCSSVSHENNKISRYDNVAYSAGEITGDNVDVVRRRPMRPSWTENFITPQKKVFKSSAEEKQQSEYIVKKGDTIYGIAHTFSLPMHEILDLNSMTKDSKLFIGQRIKLRDGGDSEKVPFVGDEFDSNGTDSTNYTVRKEDSLFKIAKMHSMTVGELKNINGIVSDKIYVGQVLKISGAVPVHGENFPEKNAMIDSPGSKKKFALDSDGLYRIQPRDSLEKIAKNFGVSVNSLKEINRVTDPSKLQIGKKLIIPSNGQIASPMPLNQPKGVAVDAVKSSSASEHEILLKQSAPGQGTGNSKLPSTNDDFFENFEEITVVEINE